MKNFIKPVIIFLTFLGGIGLFVMLSGIIPIGASSGHWPVTAWFLEFSMSRSMSTYSLTVENPPEEKEWMVQKGAGHYQIGCRQCHGGPGELKNFLGTKMTPQAPYLSSKKLPWNDKELFRIIKHGVKFTGMPAWPSLKRDDEVWAMVYFVKNLHQMSEDKYRRMVFVDDSPLELLACSNCHGVDGNGRETAAFPKLAGQNEEYLKNALKEYKEGKRPSGVMELVASSLSEEMIDEFARYYSQKKRSVSQSKKDFSSIERGKKIAYEGIPDQRVASCKGCHGPEAHKKHEGYPELKGQFAEYTVSQLKLFLKDVRKDSKFSKIMHKAISEMTEEQMVDVANYYESLGP